MAFSPTAAASYAISVRRASALPAASFRFHLAVDTLAVRLIVPLTGPIVDFHHQVIRPPPRVPKQRRQGATRHAWRTVQRASRKARPGLMTNPGSPGVSVSGCLLRAVGR